MPMTAALAGLAAASMAGVPLLNGFLSKEMMLTEALGSGILGGLAWLIPVLATLGSVLSVAYSLRYVRNVFFGPPATDLPKTPHEAPFMMRLPMLLLVALCVLIGLLPALMVTGILEAAGQATILAPRPELHLAIWHGFNLPLLMSAIALAGASPSTACAAPCSASSASSPSATR